MSPEEIVRQHMGQDALILIVHGDADVLVAISGDPKFSARILRAYEKAGMNVEILRPGKKAAA